MSATSSPLSLEAYRAEALRLARLRTAEQKLALDPLWLASRMTGTDQRSGERFPLAHLARPLSAGEVVLEGHLLSGQSSWRWQRFLAERILEERRLIVGKGRQIGVTWIALAVDVAEAIIHPGTCSLVYRQREDDAIDNLRRWWTLYRSLPAHLVEHIEVLKPDRAAQPGEGGVALRFPDGKISEVFPMTSASSAGHGRSVRRITADEAAHIERFSDIRAAIEPAAGKAAITVVSTAAGRANVDTGEGNEFHRLWVTAEAGGYKRIFLAYDVHPERDETWYGSAPEVQSLKPRQRNEQFPRNEHEAFRLTAGTWFDEDVLEAYAGRVRQPLGRYELRMLNARRGEWRESDSGPLRILQMPKPNGSYGIGADVATGAGRDFSAAYVVDLATMEFVAEYHGRIDVDIYGRDLHYLGRLYNDAEILVERGGGYGDAVIIALRDGKSGRRPYPRLYRHPAAINPKLPVANVFGFPISQRTRPLIINQLDRALRERELPYVTDDLLLELENFVGEPPADSRGSKRGPWPRAADGFHDDRCLAACLTLELYRLRGAHEDPRPNRVKRKRVEPFPWIRPKESRASRTGFSRR